jgi:hypothetical protein
VVLASSGRGKAIYMYVQRDSVRRFQFIYICMKEEEEEDEEDEEEDDEEEEA